MILLDLRMPDMNGVEFIRAVRSTRFADIPIIVTTAERETSELLRQARELGRRRGGGQAVEAAGPD